jgi:hypothetical protein
VLRASTPVPRRHAPITGIAATGDDKGYWLADADGGVYTFGDAPFYGSLGGGPRNSPIVEIVTAGEPLAGVTDGYWLIDAAGDVYTFGAAPFFGSLGGVRLDAPIVGMVAQWNGDGSTEPIGYWLVAADGGVFTFGDLPFPGSLAGHLSSPVTAASWSLDGPFVASLADGKLLEYDTSPYRGLYLSGDLPVETAVGPQVSALKSPVTYSPTRVVGVTPGLTVVNAGGAVYTTTAFFGSAAWFRLPAPIVCMRETTPDGGYWLVSADGSVFSFGNAGFYGSLA